MPEIIQPVVDALGMAFAMAWEILWPLILGFALSAAVQAVVSHSEMGRLLPDDSPRAIAIALALGAASSSCSYAAVALLGLRLARHSWRSVDRRSAAAWIPNGFWQTFFFVDHPPLAKIWGPLIGPAVAIISFVCSVGNIPLAAVLWNGGISFGGVIAFIFADLIVLPILDIYRKYYGLKMAAFLLITFYGAMAAAAFVVEFLFWELGLIPEARKARVIEASITWNYTTWLNIAFLVLAGVLVWRFMRTGGPEMLRMMNIPANSNHVHGEHGS